MTDIDDMFEQEEANRLVADSLVLKDQILQPGDYCVRVARGINIYSEILDAAECMLAGRNSADIDEEELEEINDTRATYAEPHMRFYRFTKSYSKACPHGELGDIHLATVARKLSREEFETARKLGWP